MADSGSESDAKDAKKSDSEEEPEEDGEKNSDAEEDGEEDEDEEEQAPTKEAKRKGLKRPKVSLLVSHAPALLQMLTFLAVQPRTREEIENDDEEDEDDEEEDEAPQKKGRRRKKGKQGMLNWALNVVSDLLLAGPGINDASYFLDLEAEVDEDEGEDEADGDDNDLVRPDDMLAEDEGVCAHSHRALSDNLRFPGSHQGRGAASCVSPDTLSQQRRGGGD